VFEPASDTYALVLVQNLAHPVGNATGVISNLGVVGVKSRRIAP
jgi:hypothetical protein